MRSYEAARRLFSFMAVLAWLVMIGGVIAAIAGVVIASEMGPRGYGRSPGPEILLFALPGVLIFILGILTLAWAQIGRAGVDTAEYSQQLLQLSRDSLEVSRQSLRQGEQLKSGFESLNAALPKEPSATYADRRLPEGTASTTVGAGGTTAVGYGAAAAELGDTTTGALAPPSPALESENVPSPVNRLDT